MNQIPTPSSPSYTPSSPSYTPSSPSYNTPAPKNRLFANAFVVVGHRGTNGWPWTTMIPLTVEMKREEFESILLENDITYTKDFDDKFVVFVAGVGAGAVNLAICIDSNTEKPSNLKQYTHDEFYEYMDW